MKTQRREKKVLAMVTKRICIQKSPLDTENIVKGLPLLELISCVKQHIQNNT